VVIIYKLKILEIMNNPFSIRRSPVEIIAAQAVALDDYVMRDDSGLNGIPRGGKLGIRVKEVAGAGGNDAGPVRTCSTLS
jgi:hypothetical protein